MTTRPPEAQPPDVERHVLIVDDDELLREVAKAALELVGGWRVSTAASGAEARRRAAAEQPDAILLDVMMPGLDGPATVAELRDDNATHSIPVVFLTAKMSTEDRPDRPCVGLAGVISKPFDPMTLAATMATLLGWRE